MDAGLAFRVVGDALVAAVMFYEALAPKSAMNQILARREEAKVRVRAEHPPMK